LVLERLSDARRAGRPVLAVVAGTAVNQDGASNGLTAPHGPSQERVIRTALADAGWAASSVDVVEAHGTGTRLGDPIEAQALVNTYGRDRSADAALWLGSLKSNIGHAQAAAGVAGAIKMVMAMRHGVLPRTLHVDAPSPHVDWSAGTVRLLTEARSWQRDPGHPRRAGVSSFGISGTNAHILLEEPPQSPVGTTETPESDAPEAPEPTARLLTLSAKSPTALRTLVSRSLTELAGLDDAALAAFCRTANTGRAALPHRAAVVAAGVQEMRDRLAEILTGETDSAGVRTGHARQGAASDVVFLFTGQGAQHPGMAGTLYATEPVFRAAIDRCDRVLLPLLGKPIMQIAGTDAVHETRYTQPALFAVEYALAELWRSWGVRPAAVLGHSVGELVAACVAGVMDVEDGLRLAATRGRLMHELCQPGAMAAVFATEADVREALAPYSAQLSIAGLNGPDSIVISGEPEALTEALTRFAERGVRTKRLTVQRGFHSVLMEPMLAEFERAAAGIEFRPPTIPLVSNVTGAFFADGETFSAEYLREHVRRPVDFHRGMRAVFERGHRTFLEVGPQPTLSGMAKRFAPADDDRPVRMLPSLRAAQDDWSVLLDSVGALWTEGIRADLAKLDAAAAAAADWSPVPTYPFEHSRYWLASGPATATAAAELPRVFEPEPEQPAADEPADSPRALIEAAADHERPGLVADRVAHLVARVLGLGAAAVERDNALQNLGLDSMMAVEVRGRITAEFGVEVPLAVLLDGGTVTQLSTLILDGWFAAAAATEGSVA
jgi:acyl transferase domain-containing protein